MAEPTKAEREAAVREAAKLKAKAAREAAFIAKADYNGTSAPQPQETPATTVDPSNAVEAVVEANSEAATPEQAPEVGKSPAKASAARKTARMEPKKDLPPWADADPKGKAHFSTQFPAALDKQMQWVCENVPQMSKQKIVHRALGEFLERIIAEHYKP